MRGLIQHPVSLCAGATYCVQPPVARWEILFSRPELGVLMQDSGCGLPRMHLSRTPVNKGKEDTPPPCHPRVARYPRGLRGKQATVYLAQRSLRPCLSERFAGVTWRPRGLREADPWFEGSRAPGLTQRTDSAFLSHAASPPRPHRNHLQIAFQSIYKRVSSFDSWFEGSRLVV